jgi:acyl-CoA synthetase (AMP-forming)/AMP-acid ligase II
MMTERLTLADLFIDPVSSAPAVIGTSAPAVVSYKSLSEQIERLSAQFIDAGLKPSDCVAIVLPNSLEFLVILLALTRARLVGVPLNPGYTGDEVRLLLEDSQARAVITVEENFCVKSTCADLDLPVWLPSVEASGVITIPQLRTSQVNADNPNPADVALFLYTSGTSSRPKCVPLTHANIAWSARNIAADYELNSTDRSLVVLPLFHGHGLIGATLSALASGGTVIIAPRFSASAFWTLSREHRATWYSAVPTIHQVLLERADGDGAPSGGLRFIRSCSAPLSSTIHAKLERRFGAPVLQAYGMTEAAHQVSTNPLPPLPNKPESVGTSPGLSIVDEMGKQRPANTPGEVLVSGPNVMRGYRNNPEANAAAFVDGRFRTGDIGTIDADGYLSLTGRIKELINRGGEKISPEEIEAVLLTHPAVAKAAVFGVPDVKYGEEVQAAVVPRAAVSARDLQSFCNLHLASFKVPKVIHIVHALPEDDLGKVRRRDLTTLFSAA